MLTDDELVAFLNEWADVGRDLEEWWVDIHFTGLATAFRHLIVEGPDRFLSWKERWQSLLRPVYVRYALDAAAQRIRQYPSELPVWLDLADWVMSRTDSHQDGDKKPSETLRERPDWSWARRQVVDFIAICIGKEVGRLNRIPITDFLSVICGLCRSRLLTGSRSTGSYPTRLLNRRN